MSTYDISAGASQAGLNALTAAIYAKPSVRNGLFKGTVTQSIAVIGSVTLTWDLRTVPAFNLTSPTAAQWTASQRRDPAVTTPPPNTIQLVLPDLAGTAAIAGGTPLPAEGPVTIFGVVSEVNSALTITVEAILIDESNFSAWDAAIVNLILIPQMFKLADSLIPSIPLPQLPSVGSLKFQPLVVAVQPQGVVAAASLVGDPPVSLAGYVWPAPQLFALVKLNPINKLLASEVDGTYTETDSTGPSGWSCSGSVTAKNLTVVAAINGTTVDMNVGGSFSGYGQLSGAGVGVAKAAVCPIGAAADAISDPSNWDKVTSSFDLSYSPNPMPVPVTFTAAAPSGTPLTQTVTATVPSGKLPSSIKLVVAPTWSGSVTGSALAAAAAAFTDLVLALFGKVIVTDLVDKYGSKSFSLPLSKMTKTLSLPGNTSITIGVSAAIGAGLTPVGTDQLLQSLQIAVS